MAHEDPPRARHRWRANIEAVTMALVVAVLFKYFLVEAYRIPTGSMQPTLMGWKDDDGGGVFDRVLVDKLSFHYRDPRRWEVVTFRYPLDRSKTFVKRVVGMPGEELKLEGGDVFRRALDGGEWELARRPRPVQLAMLRAIDTRGGWSFGASVGVWRQEGEDIVADSPGRGLFPGSGAPVRNGYTDGYPGALRERVRSRGLTGEDFVADLRIQADVLADPSCSEVRFELNEGLARFRFAFPGPAAPPDAAPRVAVEDPTRDVERDWTAERAWRLPAGRAVVLAAQNVDDRLELEVDGEVLLAVAVPSASDPRASVVLATEGGGARFGAATVARDVYYTEPATGRSRWTIPAGAYVMLGDNPQDSADGREWSLARVNVPDPAGGRRVLRGDWREGVNPRVRKGGVSGTEAFFRDEFGELHSYPLGASEEQGEAPAPLVPREAITGRALLVFWPQRPALGIHRLRWIR